MSYFYVVQDKELIDYGIVRFHEQWFRGPLDRGPNAIAWLGASQTFGRYAAEAFPSLVGAQLDLGTLNLGRGGAGPDYFLHRPELLEEANNCRVVVVQVMSARTCSNHLFRSKVGGDFGVRLDTGANTKFLTVIQDLLAEGRRRELRRLVRESQRAFVDSTRRLLEAVKPPTVLLWLSFRPPLPAVVGYRRTLNVFPQITTREMVRRIRPAADRYVAVVSSVGIPQTLRSLDGTSVGTNVYYASPEMHRLTADRLVPVLRELIA